MAKDITKATEPALNSDARASMIRDGFAQIYATEAEIAEMEAEYVTPLKKGRTKKWRDLKKNLDIPRKVLEGEYRQYKLARQALDNEDDTGTIEKMRETFLALHPGGQVDWIAALSTPAA